MRMFAGPNGAGKTSLMREIVTNNYADLGVILNADQIYRALTQKPFLDLSEYKQGDVTQNELESFANEFSDIEERLHKPFEHFTLRINEGFLVKKEAGSAISSYEAAFVVDFLRARLLEEGISFSFETVMSHSAKLRFLSAAKKKGFKTYLYYIASNEVEIHLQRVTERVRKGGHDVPESKVKDRYYRSLGHLFEAVKLVDRAFLIDNSEQENRLIAEKTNDQDLIVYEDKVPWWVNHYLLDYMS